MVCPLAEQIERVIREAELPLRLDEVTIGDGNCFARAVVQQCQRKPVNSYLRNRQLSLTTYMTVKREVCQFMLKEINVPMLRQFKEGFEARQSEARLRGEMAENWNQYWMKMSRDREWVDAIFVQATAWYLYSDIILIPSATATQEQPFFTISGNYISETVACPGPPLLLGYNSNLHYQSVLPIDEEQDRINCLDPQTIDSVLKDVLKAMAEASKENEEKGDDVSSRINGEEQGTNSDGGSLGLGLMGNKEAIKRKMKRNESEDNVAIPPKKRQIEKVRTN